MNRRALERHLRANGCVFDHHGRRHDFWVNLKAGTAAPVLRHRQLKRETARSICRILGIPIPPGI